MATGAAFADAAQTSATNPRLSVGCHVVLVDGIPVSDDVASLRTHGGGFRVELPGFALAALRHRLAPADIEREVTAQIRKLQAAGISVSHVDTHKHTHMFPPVLEPLLRAAAACGVRAVRNPFAPPLRFAQVARRPRLWKRSTQVMILRRWAPRFRDAVRAAGLATTDGSFGVVATGALDLELFVTIVGSIPEGTWEFVCHPGYDDNDLARTGTRLLASRPLELQALTSPEARAALDKAGVELISFRDLTKP